MNLLIFILVSIGAAEKTDAISFPTEVLGQLSKSLGKIESNETSSFSVSDFKNIFDRLFINCTRDQTTSFCQLCLTAEELFTWKGINTSSAISNETVFDLLAGVVYFLVPERNLEQGFGAVCKTDAIKASKLSHRTNWFEHLLSKYGGSEGSLRESNLQALLNDVNTSLAGHLQKTECFSAHNIISSGNISRHGGTQIDFQYSSAFIILKLINGHCIADEHDEDSSHLPSGEFFWQQILAVYGENGSFTGEHVVNLIKELGLGAESNTTEAVQKHSLKRRDLNAIKTALNSRMRRSADDGDFKGKCFSPDEFLKIYSIDRKSTVNKSLFQDISTALVQQIGSGVCKNLVAVESSGSSNTWKSWVAAIISITVINLISLAGLLTAPLNKKKWFTSLLMFLICLAISTLVCDAVLHLLPEALELHGHEDSGKPESAHEESVLGPDSYIWKSVCLLIGIYVFYMFELLMHAFRKGHSHSHGLEDSHKHVGRGNSHKDVKGTIALNENPEYHRRANSVIRSRPSGLHDCESDRSDVSLDEIDQKQGNAVIKNPNVAGEDHAIHFNKDDDRSSRCMSPVKTELSATDSVFPLQEGSKQPKAVVAVASVRAVVWMVMVGDAIHNFMDGVAVGVAFSKKFPVGLQGGISTSIAILCHELPHELGDFAILLNSGTSIKFALLLNFAASLTAYVGAIVGVGIGTVFNGSGFVFSATGGMFLYIALVDMLPEVLHSGLVKKHPFRSIFVQNVGLWIGFAIMFLLAVFEEEITHALKS